MAKQKSMRSRTPVISKTSPSFVSLEQGFRDFIKELNKIEVFLIMHSTLTPLTVSQLFMDVNGTGFAKILKKVRTLEQLITRFHTDVLVVG